MGGGALRVARLVAEIKDLLRRSYDRHDKLALIIQATTVALELRSGHLLIAKDMEIPDLNSIFDYPNSEESKHAAGFVVTTCGNLTGMMAERIRDTETPPFRWQRYFWNCCFQQQPHLHE